MFHLFCTSFPDVVIFDRFHKCRPFANLMCFCHPRLFLSSLNIFVPTDVYKPNDLPDSENLQLNYECLGKDAARKLIS